MTKRDFENEVKVILARDEAKVVDMITTKEKDGLFKDTYISTGLAIRNRVVYKYSAWNNLDNEVTVRFLVCLGAY